MKGSLMQAVASRRKAQQCHPLSRASPLRRLKLRSAWRRKNDRDKENISLFIMSPIERWIDRRI